MSFLLGFQQMLSEFLLFVFALIINERKKLSARKRLLTPKDQIDVLISFPDKPFSDKLNVFLYKQYFAKTQFYKNMINFTAISKNILFKQQGIMLKGVKSAEKQTFVDTTLCRAVYFLRY